MDQQTALITGASTGIGAELARLFAADGYRLVLVARSRDRLESLATELSGQHGASVRVMGKDLADPAAPGQLYDELAAAGVRVDVLVNNAGVGLYGEFRSNDRKREMDMLQLNVVALTLLSKLFLPGMVERRRGRILNLASTAAFQPGPLMAVYYASKAYVLSLSQALANELQGTGVTVTALCPGPTRTEFESRADLSQSRLFKLVPASDARTVARIGYRGLMQGKPVVIPGLLNWLLAESVRFAPRRMATAMARAVQERVG